jgi:hypothetical protein
MKKTTFFTITAVIVLLLGGYFVLRMNSMQAIWCRADFDFNCECYAQLTCASQGGDFMGEITGGGECIGNNCYGTFLIECSNQYGRYRETIECVDTFCPDCYPDN